MLLQEKTKGVNCLQWITGIETYERISRFLRTVDEEFSPSLSSRTNINEYARKLAMNAHTLFLKKGTDDLASASVYCNKDDAFLTSIAVKPEFTHQGLGTGLMTEIKNHCRKENCKHLRLQVYKGNEDVVRFYLQNDMTIEEELENYMFMITKL